MLVSLHTDLSSIPEIGHRTFGMLILMAPQTYETGGGTTHCCAPLIKQRVGLPAFVYATCSMAVAPSLHVGVSRGTFWEGIAVPAMAERGVQV